MARHPIVPALVLSLAVVLPPTGTARAGADPAAKAAGSPSSDRVADLEARVKTLEEQLAAVRQQIAGLTQQGADRERAAEEIAADIGRLAASLDLAPAKARLAEFDAGYANTAAAKKIARLRDELAVVGKAAPPKLEVEKWFQGGPQPPPGKVTLYVFFEAWCPHCKREIPKLQAMHEALKEQGLALVGLTRLSRGTTDEQLVAFVADGKVTYPIAKETGALSQYFNVSGIPAAAIVKDGKVIWRGNPSRLDADKVKTLLP